MRALNYRERLFAMYYVGEAKGNAAQAARMAGYSERSASVQGNKLLRNPQIFLLVQKKTQSAAMDAEEVLARLSDMASSSIEDFVSTVDEPDEYDDSGNLKRRGRRKQVFDYDKASRRGKLGSIKKFEVLPDGGVRFELHDAQSALEKLMKYHGLGRDRIELTQISDGSDNTIQRVTAVLCGAFKLAGQVGDRTAVGEDLARALGVDRERGGMGAGEAPGVPEPETRPGS